MQSRRKRWQQIEMLDIVMGKRKFFLITITKDIAKQYKF